METITGRSRTRDIRALRIRVRGGRYGNAAIHLNPNNGADRHDCPDANGHAAGNGYSYARHEG